MYDKYIILYIGSEWSLNRQINVTGRTSYMLNSSLIPETSYEIRLIQSFVSNCLQRASPVTKFVTNSEKICYFLLSANF